MKEINLSKVSVGSILRSELKDNTLKLTFRVYSNEFIEGELEFDFPLDFFIGGVHIVKRIPPIKNSLSTFAEISNTSIFADVEFNHRVKMNQIRCKENPPLEVTLEDIEKRYGRKVKIISEKTE